MPPEHALIIAHTLKHVGLVLGLAGIAGLCLLFADLIEQHRIGRDIDDDL